MPFQSFVLTLLATLWLAGQAHSAGPCDEFVARLPNLQRSLCEAAKLLKPQLIVSINGPYGVLEYDGPAKEGFVPPSKLGRLYIDQVGIFPGSLGNYGGVHKGIPVVTIELPDASHTPLDLLRWMNERVGQEPGQRPTPAPVPVVAGVKTSADAQR